MPAVRSAVILWAIELAVYAVGSQPYGHFVSFAVYLP
jgi:hypothetical protein